MQAKFLKINFPEYSAVHIMNTTYLGLFFKNRIRIP